MWDAAFLYLKYYMLKCKGCQKKKKKKKQGAFLCTNNKASEKKNKINPFTVDLKK